MSKKKLPLLGDDASLGKAGSVPEADRLRSALDMIVSIVANEEDDDEARRQVFETAQRALEAAPPPQTVGPLRRIPLRDQPHAAIMVSTAGDVDPGDWHIILCESERSMIIDEIDISRDAAPHFGVKIKIAGNPVRIERMPGKCATACYNIFPPTAVLEGTEITVQVTSNSDVPRRFQAVMMGAIVGSRRGAP